MEPIDIVGIGNALVDQEFEVTDEFLQQHQIEKGMMTLIEDADQERLIAELANRGELKKQSGGGSAANSLVGFAQFGGKAFYCCKVADDEAGKFYCEDLEAVGITTNTGSQKHEGKTGRCLVMVTPDAERTMRTYLGITADLSVAELDEAAIARAEYLYIEGYLVTSPIALEAIARAKEIARANGTKIAMTCSDPAMVKYFGDGIEAILDGGVDVMFCNQEEARILTGTDDVQEAMQLLQQRAHLVAITLGKDGALLGDGSRQVAVPGVKVKAVDTNGAGDMFAGAMMYGITRGYSLAACGLLASHAAAEVVSNFGPRLSPDRQQQLLIRLQHQPEFAG
ncbi:MULTISPECIES: adenosine kinase [Pseudidiomarina]|uniref:Sugar/nucleoside kinase (Ribokinase family) n=2 Tax=Pseudidiomarina TaxID=2800384 RepID=A0A368UL29_9GAMM|nr:MULTISPECIES: adenosine kinase [Pseudidiomarina]PWW09707.1 sugar/nucleoside kinase (ribokinase family) [Pseudidiomarina maritima]RBP87423.1 sugar/nucleoside kinase (ribokinase family) [Pseudidiomarina tainanensis]RCW29478.1 sugar/nucleoside kinase (ribokinase family) [Pseudidiomarina tainanensis]